MATQDAASLAAVIETMVSGIVQETLIQSAVVLPTIDNRSGEVRPGMDQLDIARLTALAVQTVTEGSEVTPATSTVAVDSLVLNKNKAITWALSDRGSVQSKIDMAASLVRDAAKSMAAGVDDDIITELQAASAAAPDHLVQFANTPTDTLQAVDIREARRLLNVQNVPMDDRWLLVGPDQEKALLGISEFIEADKYGFPGASSALANGELGRLFGFRVIMSTSANLAATDAIFYQRESVAYASQISPKFESDRNILKLEDEFALSMLYGVKVLDSGKRQVVFNATGA